MRLKMIWTGIPVIDNIDINALIYIGATLQFIAIWLVAFKGKYTFRIFFWLVGIAFAGTGVGALLGLFPDRQALFVHGMIVALFQSLMFFFILRYGMKMESDKYFYIVMFSYMTMAAVYNLVSI
jgi:hypothetical protein